MRIISYGRAGKQVKETGEKEEGYFGVSLYFDPP